MDLSTVLLVIAVLIGLGMILCFAFVVYAFKEFNKIRERSQKELGISSEEFAKRWREANERRR